MLATVGDGVCDDAELRFIALVIAITVRLRLVLAPETTVAEHGSLGLVTSVRLEIEPSSSAFTWAREEAGA